jgi:hypothetical protein
MALDSFFQTMHSLSSAASLKLPRITSGFALNLQRLQIILKQHRDKGVSWDGLTDEILSTPPPTEKPITMPACANCWDLMVRLDVRYHDRVCAFSCKTQYALSYLIVYDSFRGHQRKTESQDSAPLYKG